MPNYDDLFTGQPAQREEKPFDKTVWAAKKQAEREGVYAMIDNYVQDMGKEGGLFQAYLDVQARFDLYSVSDGGPGLRRAGTGAFHRTGTSS